MSESKKIPMGSATLRGLRRQGSTWSWRLEWYPSGRKGRMHTLALGRHEAEEAQRLAAEHIARGLPTAPAERPVGRQVETVRDLLHYWKGAEEQRLARGEISEHTYDAARHAVTRLVGTAEAPLPLRAVRLDQLTTRRIEGERDRRIRADDAPSTVDLDLRILRQAILWGSELGLLDARTLPRVRVTRRAGETRYNRRIPSHEDVASILAALEYDWHRRCLLLLYDTGARPSEICEATWSDLDGDMLSIQGKTGRRIVPLSEMTLSALGQRQPGGVRLIGEEAPRLASTGGGLRAALTRACDRAGVARVTPKGFRRLMSRDLQERGTRGAVYVAQMGHSLEMGQRIYDEATAEDQRRAVAAVRGDGPSGGLIELEQRRKARGA